MENYQRPKKEQKVKKETSLSNNKYAPDLLEDSPGT